MSDGIAITAGSGTTVLTDETASGHAQVVKLAIATDASATLIPADGTDGLLVNLGANNDVTVTGSALTALQLIDNPVFADDAAFTLTSSSVNMAGAIRDDSLSALSAAEGDAVPLRVNSTGALHVTGGGGGTQYAVDDALGSTPTGTVSLAIRDDALSTLTPVEGDAIGLRVDSTGALWCNVSNTVTVASHAVTNAGTFAVQAVCTNAGTFATQSVCTNAGTFAVQVDGSALTSLQLIDDTVYTDDAAFTPGTSKVLGVGFEADEGSTDSVDEGDIGAARMTLDRKIIVTPQPHTAGGLSTFMASGSDGSTILVATAQVVKASAGQIYGYYAYNPEAAATFVHFYNVAAASVTVGTTAPLVSFAIPAGAAANLSFTHGVTFDTAISCSATTTAGGNTAPATGVSLVAWYK